MILARLCHLSAQTLSVAPPVCRLGFSSWSLAFRPIHDAWLHGGPQWAASSPGPHCLLCTTRLSSSCCPCYLDGSFHTTASASTGLLSLIFRDSAGQHPLQEISSTSLLRSFPDLPLHCVAGLDVFFQDPSAHTSCGFYTVLAPSVFLTSLLFLIVRDLYLSLYPQSNCLSPFFPFNPFTDKLSNCDPFTIRADLTEAEHIYITFQVSLQRWKAV